MTEPKNKPTEVSDETRISMTASELKSMISDSQKETAQLLANAILEARKPYIDPRAAINDELFRQTSHQIEERKREMVKTDQSSCSHLQGSNNLSERTGDLTAIAWHRYDDQIIRGICTNCQRQFLPSDPDYVTQFRRKSGNRISSAGRRDYLVPQVPQNVQVAVPAVDAAKETVDA